MTYIPYSPQKGAKYWLIGPDGTTAVFNDPADVNYVGMLTDISGLDSANVRESGDDLAQTDGGWHGNFYYGRRPITLSGSVFGHSSADARTARLDRLMRASNAMRQDATLQWLNTDLNAVKMQTLVRRQQPLRITGAWVKDFQLQVVSADAPLFSAALHQQGNANILAQSFEDNADFPSNWTATNGTLAWSTTTSLESTHSAQATANGGGVLNVHRTSVKPGIGGSNPAALDNYLWSPFTSNYTHTFAFWSKANTTVRSWAARVIWYDASGAVLQTDTGSFVANNAVTWTRSSVTAVAPTSAVGFQVSMLTSTTPANGEIHYLDQLAMMNSSSAPNGFTTSLLTVENQGNSPVYPLVAWMASNTPQSVTVTNTTNNTKIVTQSLLYPYGDVYVIDTLNHTLYAYVLNYGPGLGLASSFTGYIDFVASDPWLRLDPGNNTLQITSTAALTGSSGIWVSWRDAWM